MSVDYHLLDKLPPEIVEAARKLDTYFRKQGTEDWALLGVCSRTMYERCKAKHDALVDRIAHPYLGGWNFPPSA